MARIRSIHPNTPTDPDFALLPVAARLLFIYSWTIADDAGNLEASPRGLKMALFPGDDKLTAAKIGKFVDLLIAGRFYEPYEVDGKAYLHLRSFAKYQKLEKPGKNRFPLFPGQSHTYFIREGNSWIKKEASTEFPGDVRGTSEGCSGVVRAGLDRTGLEGKGKEGTGLEGSPAAPACAREAPRAADGKDNGEHAPIDDFADVFGDVPPEVLEKITALPKARQSALGSTVRSVRIGESKSEHVRKTLIGIFGIPASLVEVFLPETTT